MEYLLLSVITLLISTISGDVEISFMKTVPRLNNSMYCDYYFACHAEGETLQWIINNNNISDYSRQSVGHVFTGSISTCKYTASLLLLKQLSPGQSIFDSVLIVSCQNSIDFDVVCTNGSVYRMTNSSEKTQNTRAENNVTSVHLERVLNENLVAGDIASCTNIFLCGVNNGFFRWQIQENSFAFGTFNDIGTVRQFLQDTTAVEQQAILIGNEPYDLVVVMIVLGSAEINVTCGYPGNTVNLVSTLCPVNMETTGSETSTVGESTTSGSTPIINNAAIIGIVAGVALVLVLVIIWYCFFGRLLIKQYNKISRLNNEAMELNETMELTVYDMMRRRIRLRGFYDDYAEDDIEPEIDTGVPEESYMKPIHVNNFSKFFRSKDKEDIYEEYELLKKLRKSFPTSCEKGSQHAQKNINNKYLPYDYSRVKLESIEGVQGSDYINASYIDGYKKENAYITTQEPIPTTKDDFWRMIYERGVTTIVMFRESDKWESAMQYWPDTEKIIQYPNNMNLKITFKVLKRFLDYDIRTFTLEQQPNTNQTEIRTITHYFFLTWPDKKQSRFTAPFIQFICHIKSDEVRNDTCSSPIVVHSLLGSGRTGVFIALHALMEQMKEDKTVGIFAFVMKMRTKRMRMVRNKFQYGFIYNAVNELCISGNTSVKASDLGKEIIKLSERDEKTGDDGFTDQFTLLKTVCRQPQRIEQSDALKYWSKNSCLSSLPYNDNRVVLESINYISACFVHGYKTSDAYIATQIPWDETIQDFWNMIWEQKHQTIVLLGPLQERNMIFSKFWPSGSQNYGALNITLAKEEQIQDYKEMIIHISDAQTTGVQKVTFYHYQNWQEHEQPNNTVGIRDLISRLKEQQKKRYQTVVMCSDGVGRTGAFITICEMIEKFHEEEYVDFFRFIILLRIDRTDLVRQPEQYKFCHEVVNDYIKDTLTRK